MRLLYFPLVVLLLFFSSSCNEDDSSSPGSGDTRNIPPESMRADVDLIRRDYLTVYSLNSSGNITLVGAMDNSGADQITISLNETTLAGTYSFPSNEVILDFYQAGTLYAPTNGQIIINSHNTLEKRVIGTFQFDEIGRAHV